MFTFRPSLIFSHRKLRLDTRPDREWQQLRISIAAVLSAAIFSLFFGPLMPTAGNGLGEFEINLAAANQKTIEYRTNNGIKIGAETVESYQIPHLVLYRNKTLAEPPARTIQVAVNGIEIPPGGATISLEATTLHSDLGSVGDNGMGITVWRESTWINNPTPVTKHNVSVVYSRVFTQSVQVNAGPIPTPTDYYDLTLTVLEESASGQAVKQTHRISPAFLLENQWVELFPSVPEILDGAAPDELVVYYCDMSPFQHVMGNPGTRLPRASIPGYVGGELAPEMVQAYDTMSQDWGYAWAHPWHSWRSEDGLGQLSVALSDGEHWYHGPAAYQGNAGISINPANPYLADYDTLTHGFLSTFYHEVFHNMQRSINLAYGGSGNVGGLSNDWTFFSEGTAVLASLVGQPEIQLEAGKKSRAYLRNASTFVGKGLVASDLNKSYTRMVPQHTAIYWRFLYEQCGGWDIIWHTLDVLYAGEVADPNTSTQFLPSLAPIMDRALGESTCPFQNYHDSLKAFAQAIYLLRLGGGRCQDLNRTPGCGFFDPNGLYPEPTVVRLEAALGEQTYTDRINSSYGLDFLEIEISPGLAGCTLSVAVSGDINTVSEFNIQGLVLKGEGDGEAGLDRVMVLESQQITLEKRSMTFVLEDVDSEMFNTLALILVRTDAHEDLDPAGAYTVRLQAGE